MITGTIFTFDTGHKTNWDRVRFFRGLYGHTEFSNFGKYTYDRPGILSTIPHIRPTESVIIVNNKNAKLLREFLKNENARFSEHKIILTEKEFRNLS